MCSCGAPGNWEIDPFMADVRGEYEYVVYCPACLHERAGEV